MICSPCEPRHARAGSVSSDPKTELNPDRETIPDSVYATALAVKNPAIETVRFARYLSNKAKRLLGRDYRKNAPARRVNYYHLEISSTNNSSRLPAQAHVTIPYNINVNLELTRPAGFFVGNVEFKERLLLRMH